MTLYTPGTNDYTTSSYDPKLKVSHNRGKVEVTSMQSISPSTTPSETGLHFPWPRDLSWLPQPGEPNMHQGRLNNITDH